MNFNNPAIREYGEPVKGRQRYVLTEPLVFRTQIGRGHIEISVPSNFVTDFASVPCFLWFLFPPAGRWSRAAVLHDYLYTKAAGCSRFFADSLFREAMRSLGVSWWRRVTMYYAVRFCGWRYWRKDT